MNMLKSGPVLGAIAFIGTLLAFIFIYRGVNSDRELVLKFENPQMIETPDLQAYTLDTVNGPEKDLTFRCNPVTGEGYFSLKSENLAWTSSHCQDMLGAVKDIEEKKKPIAQVTITVVERNVLYRVERNK